VSTGTYLEQLPSAVAHQIRTKFIAQFATVSSAGVPINTPVVPFTSEDLQTIDAGTGLAYPAKAERARRNPKVGMLLEGSSGDPVVSIAGMAAVRDSDFQANLERYLSEVILASLFNPQSIDYQTVTRQAIWYFTRMLICVKPSHIRWWRSPAAMDAAPQEWHAPPDTRYPPSDPPPPASPAGFSGKAPWAQASPWQSVAQQALARQAPAHLTLLDADGYPLPIPARRVQVTAEGFDLTMPAWLPWSEGKATLSFEGIETFIGHAHVDRTGASMSVERALPVLPLMTDPSETLTPRPATKQAMLERIEYELARRGCQLPRMPDIPPQPTAGAVLRASEAMAFAGFSAASN
jgi:general stress protein 26